MWRVPALALCLAMVAGPSTAKPVQLSDAALDAITAGTDFSVSNLVSDQMGVAANTDPNLVNPWGLVVRPNGRLWVADNGVGKSTLYNSDGTPQSTVVDIPAPGGGAGAPTGVAFNRSQGFDVSANGKSAPSTLLFATEDGTIAGWSSSVNPTQAVLAVDQSGQGAVFKGLTVAQTDHGRELFAADFHNGRVDIFNNQFQMVGSFTDNTVPSGFAPFNVQNIGGQLYVTFAKQDAKAHDDVAGVGNGFVDVFNTNGQMQRRLTSGGPLNSPWGLVIAPGSFGTFAHALLIGNFGDGSINAFDPNNGAFLGTLTGANGQPLSIDGLWSLRRGQGGSVVFTSGPGSEMHGLLGSISPASNSTTAAAGVSQATRVTSLSSLLATVRGAAANAVVAAH